MTREHNRPYEDPKRDHVIRDPSMPDQAGPEMEHQDSADTVAAQHDEPYERAPDAAKEEEQSIPTPPIRSEYSGVQLPLGQIVAL